MNFAIVVLSLSFLAGMDEAAPSIDVGEAAPSIDVDDAASIDLGTGKEPDSKYCIQIIVLMETLFIL